MFETNNNIFQAIDTIISQRLNEMKYDKTIVCEIIQKKDNGEYIVFDNTTKFTAYAEKDKEYFENQKVYVIVPQDNYTMKKIIIGHYSSDNDKMAYEFLNPFENVVDITGNLAAAAIPSEGVELSSEGQTASFTFSIGNIADNLGTLKYIGLKTNITTVMPDTHEGQYGILLTLIDTLDNVDSFIFDSSQMYGNPYYYDEGFDLEKVFVYPEGKTYTEGTIQFYSEVDGNVLFNNTYVCFGYDQSDFTSPVLSIKSFDDTDLEYTNDRDIVKIFATLIDKDSEGKYYRRNIDNKISWYKYTLGHSNDGIGNHWQRIEYADGSGPLGEFDNNNTFAEGITFPSTKNQFEQIVAAYKFDDNNIIKSNALNYEYTGNASSDLTELYHIELTNDSATVSAPLNTAIVDTEDNKFLENITKTEVQLYYGNDLLTGNDLPDGVAYKWSLSGDINEDVFYSSTDTSEFYFTGIGEETTSIKASVEVRISEILIGTKSFNFSVVRNGAEGAAAVAYKLIPSRNTVHEEDDDKTVTFTVQKITGGTISTDFTEGYFILPKGTSSPLGTDNKATIAQTTTFELYVGEISGNATIWDTETIGYVENGSAGRGISSVKNYYKATSTNQVPEKPKEGEAPWPTTIEGTGHSSKNPYLWNYERTEYTDNSSTETDVALLSSKPRSIASVTEYYYVGKTPPNITYGDANNNSVIGTGGWYTTPPDFLASGQILWNCEVIEYTITDEEGKNLFQINPKQQVGYVGEDGTSPYFIELTNDSATIGAAAGEITGETLEKATTTTVKVFEGKNEIISGLTYSWSADGGNIDNKDDDPATIYFTKINNNVDSATATVIVEYNGIELQKTFSVSVARRGDNGDDAISYRLIVSPNTVKSSDTVLTFTVQKITGGNVENLKTGYTISPSTTTISETTTFNLKIGDSTWDSETVGFVSDGKGIAEVINYYQATSTDTAPGYDNGNWKTDITETGHGNDKPYLWNYEEIKYTIGDPTKTQISLITSLPQSIVSVNEFYYVNDGATPTAPTFTDSGTVTNYNGWTTSYDVSKATSGVTIWNIEQIIYAQKVDGNKYYTVTSPQIVTYIGKDGAPGGKGDPGTPGKDARYIEKTTTLYYGTNGNAPEAPENQTPEGTADPNRENWKDSPVDDWKESAGETTKYTFYTCIETKWNKAEEEGQYIYEYSTPVQDTSASTIGAWCAAQPGGKILMNGGSIAADSIEANSIKVNSITTNHIQTEAITASKMATIAGFNFEDSQIYGETEEGFVGISAKGSSAFWAGSVESGETNFSVSHQGYLNATGATIEGVLTATSGTFNYCTINDTCRITKVEAIKGNVGGIQINGQDLYVPADSTAGGSSVEFYPESDLCFRGNIINNGKTIRNRTSYYDTSSNAWYNLVYIINIDQNNSSTRFVFNHGVADNCEYIITNTKPDDNKDLNVLKWGSGSSFDFTTDELTKGVWYFIYNSPHQISLDDEDDDKSDQVLDIFQNFPPFLIEGSTGSAFFQRAYIKEGSYFGNNKELAIGNRGSWVGFVKGNETNNLCIGFSSGIVIGNHDAGQNNEGHAALIIYNQANGLLIGTWQIQKIITDSPEAITSDQKKKHEIESLNSSYSTLFDNLSPITYKYNDGTSDRKHVGFIAQQVGQALEVANISTQDFAGLVIDDKDNWYLRYDEFIALNTWQIQKLKSRVAELEQEIATLKNK